MVTGVSRINALGNSLVVQWLVDHALPARGLGSILGWGPKISQAKQHSRKKGKRINVLDTAAYKQNTALAKLCLEGGQRDRDHNFQFQGAPHKWD